MMRQLEIEFFWPLTQQMPLDLDYTNCHQPKLGITLPPVNGATGYSLLTTNGSSLQWSTSLVASNMTIDVGTTVFKVEEQPPLYRRVLYKLMNIKWEKK
jgi:hypothetical protein